MQRKANFIKIISVYTIVITGIAQADWALQGVRVICNPENHYFSLSSTEITDDDYRGLTQSQIDDKNEKLADEGFYYSGSRSVECKMKDTMISVGIHIEPPRARGYCGGVNTITITDFKLNDNVFDLRRNFNHECFSSSTGISLEKKNGVWKVEECSRPEGSLSEESCKTVSLSELLVKPAFDCAKASNRTEKTICSNMDLIKHDNELNAIYKRLAASLNKSEQLMLRNIQRAWIKARNKEKDTLGLRFQYNYQIQRLRYLENIKQDLSVKSNLDIEGIFTLLVKKNIPAPNTIQLIRNGMYIANVAHYEPDAQGVYLLNVNRGKIIKIVTGLHRNLQFLTREKSVQLYKATTLKGGKMYGQVVLIYPDSNSKQGMNGRAILSLLEDGESGGCGRGEMIGIKQAVEMQKHTLKAREDNYKLVLQIKETDCSSNSSALRTEVHILDKDGYRKVLNEE